jgi:hypothetical protein
VKFCRNCRLPIFKLPPSVKLKLETEPMPPTTTTTPAAAPDLSTMPPDDDVTCAASLAERWRAADLPPTYPATSDTVADLLRGCGYDISAELIADWARRGVVPDVPMQAGRRAWGPRHIATAFALCETWRRWQPNHPRHLHKATAVELAEWQAQAITGRSAFDDLDQFDARALVLMLERVAEPDMRHVIAVALLSKLRALGVDDK